jgi:tRNA(Arg) A34 adenosine deaminase TadA
MTLPAVHAWIRRLNRRGRSREEIARIVGWAESSVARVLDGNKASQPKNVAPYRCRDCGHLVSLRPCLICRDVAHLAKRGSTTGPFAR